MKNIRNICFVIILLIAASAVFADDLSIGEIKSRADNAAATCTNKIVTYVSDDCFYIKDSAAYTGIKVLKANSGRSVGDIVNVQGTLGTDSNGERYINPLAVNLISSAGTVSAVTMSNVAMGGGDYNYESDTGAGQAGITDASGTNNIGSYIRIFGTVSYSDSGSEFMYIDDGSGVYDGNKLNSDGVKGVRVFLNGAKAPLEKTYYAASGISSLMILNGKTVRLLLASSTTLSSDWKPVLDMSMAKISGGTFLMGNSGVGDDADFGYAREYPQHSVYVPGFWMSKTEVTRAQFNEFVKFGGYYRPQYWSKDGWKWRLQFGRTAPNYWTATVDWGLPTGSFGFTQSDNYPVVGVSYYEAEAYCKWAGGHLPSEAEWEKAARWNGSSSNVYPWGNVFTKGKANDWFDTTTVGYKTAPVTTPTSELSNTNGNLETAGDMIVELDARNFTDGAASWNNTASASIGNFTKRGAPVLGSVGGVTCLTFNGGDDAFIGPISPDSICGNGPCSIEVWAYNPSYSDEETILSWAKRGGPEATTRTFNFGSSTSYGAFGHWANDLGWNGNPPTSTWRYLVYTYDGTTAKIYDNATLKSYKEITLNTYKGYTINIAIQNDVNGTPNTYPGTLSIAQARIYTGVLTAAQIKSNFALDASRMGALSTSPYGCTDMSGNVWEWTSDWYKSYPNCPITFDKTDSMRTMRGGSWYGVYGERCASRWFAAPTDSFNYVGFRIAY